MIQHDALSGVGVEPVRRLARPLRPAVLAGCFAAFFAAGAEAAPGAATAPLSGILRADGAPLAGVSLVVRGLTGAATSVVRVLKTDAEGTFCLADARPGVYSILAAVPGFRSATAQVGASVSAVPGVAVRSAVRTERASGITGSLPRRGPPPIPQRPRP